MNMLNRVLSKPVEVKPTDFDIDKYETDPFAGESEGDFNPADFDDEDEGEAEGQEQEIEVEEVPEAQEAEEKTKFGHVKWENLYKHKMLVFPYRILGVKIDDKLQILDHSGKWKESSFSVRDLITDKSFVNVTADDFSPRLAALIEGE